MSDTSRDILTAFEPLKNHEIFTPVRLANEMLDMLPKDVWKHPEYKFLDPATKSGVFLREIYIRLFDSLAGMGGFVADDGMVYDLNDPKQRTNHILKNMIYGISYSELTGYVSRRTLYGVRKANTDKQNASLDSFIKSKSFAAWDEKEKHDFIGRNKFNEYFDHTLFNVPDRVGHEAEGNIFYPADEVSKIKMESGDALIEEAYYPFMKSTETKHKFINQIKEGKMKFDVIIGNPPYQISDGGGNGSSAGAIYHHFVMQALHLQPKFLSMIMPARWMTGCGKGDGLKEFAHVMRTGENTCGRVSYIKTFPNSSECFSGVTIMGGVMYFLWEYGYAGKCEINGEEFDLTELDFIVDNKFKRSILQKVRSLGEPSVSEIVSERRPFGFQTNFSDYSKTMKHGDQLRIYGNRNAMKDSGGVGYIDRSAVTKNIDWIDQYKVFIAMAHGGLEAVLGKPIIGLPGDVCTETYLVIGPFSTKKQSENMSEYIKTKFFRYIVSIIKTTQSGTSRVYEYVPMLDMDKRWTDKELYVKYGLDDDEIAEIERSIKDRS